MGRPAVKAKPTLFKFRKDLDAYLRDESDRLGQTMVKFVEEMLEYRRRFKTFPPIQLKEAA